MMMMMMVVVVVMMMMKTATQNGALNLICSRNSENQAENSRPDSSRSHLKSSLILSLFLYCYCS